jgi:hypothetical protein
MVEQKGKGMMVLWLNRWEEYDGMMVEQESTSMTV